MISISVSLQMMDTNFEQGHTRADSVPRSVEQQLQKIREL
jgi:hypothetical protein